MAGGKVGIAAALLVMAPVIAATMLPAASGHRVVVATTGAGGGGSGSGSEAADQCVSRCAGEMLACEAASGCAATLSRRGGRRDGGGACKNEYLGCIDVR